MFNCPENSKLLCKGGMGGRSLELTSPSTLLLETMQGWLSQEFIALVTITSYECQCAIVARTLEQLRRHRFKPQLNCKSMACPSMKPTQRGKSATQHLPATAFIKVATNIYLQGINIFFLIADFLGRGELKSNY